MHLYFWTLQHPVTTTCVLKKKILFLLFIFFWVSNEFTIFCHCSSIFPFPSQSPTPFKLFSYRNYLIPQISLSFLHDSSSTVFFLKRKEQYIQIFHFCFNTLSSSTVIFETDQPKKISEPE